MNLSPKIRNDELIHPADVQKRISELRSYDYLFADEQDELTALVSMAAEETDFLAVWKS